MVLFLIEYFNINNSIFNVVNYITIRSGLSLMTSLFFILIFGPYLIKLIAKFQLEGQPIRLDGPESHLIAKKGTPTMGGF
ncbi:MAG: phospho-N-acetylmuramoyl-pentapeptide-transferase, partial [Pelagibacterales bacterium]|nr:phospho-N-acetylmuramoyl-pentapeptide-transferase [Pelagibacterales bacterium]